MALLDYRLTESHTVPFDGLASHVGNTPLLPLRRVSRGLPVELVHPTPQNQAAAFTKLYTLVREHRLLIPQGAVTLIDELKLLRHTISETGIPRFGNRDPVFRQRLAEYGIDPTGFGHVTGLGQQNAGQLMAILAPVVMAALANHVQRGGVTPGGLGGMLGQQSQQIQQQGGMLGGLLNAVLGHGGGNLDLSGLIQGAGSLLGGMTRR